MIAFPFFAIGAFLGYGGLRGVLRLLRFGHWRLEIAGPGALVQPLPVSLFPGRNFTPSGDIRCDLRCLNVAIVNTGKNQRMETKTLWEMSWTVTSTTIPKDLGLSLTLPLPADGVSTSQASGNGAGVKWQLTVLGPAQALSEEPIFDVPVRG